MGGYTTQNASLISGNLSVTGNATVTGSLAVGSIDATTYLNLPTVSSFKFQKTITRAQLLTLDSVPVTMSAADLGLTATQGAKVAQLATEWWVSPDGSAFTQSATVSIVLKTNTGGTAISHLPMTEAVGTVPNRTFQSNVLSSAFGSATVIRVSANDGFYLEAVGGSIGGGGAAAFIKMVIYYQKIEF